MTRFEFIQKTQVEVSEKEYAAIEVVYMASDLGKDEFCQMWRTMNRSRVIAAKVERMEKEREQAKRDAMYKIMRKWNSQPAGIVIMDIQSEEFFNRYEKQQLENCGIELNERAVDVIWKVRKYLGLVA